MENSKNETIAQRDTEVIASLCSGDTDALELACVALSPVAVFGKLGTPTQIHRDTIQGLFLVDWHDLVSTIAVDRHAVMLIRLNACPQFTKL